MNWLSFFIGFSVGAIIVGFGNTLNYVLSGQNNEIFQKQLNEHWDRSNINQKDLISLIADRF